MPTTIKHDSSSSFVDPPMPVLNSLSIGDLKINGSLNFNESSSSFSSGTLFSMIDLGGNFSLILVSESTDGSTDGFIIPDEDLWNGKFLIIKNTTTDGSYMKIRSNSGNSILLGGEWGMKENATNPSTDFYFTSGDLYIFHSDGNYWYLVACWQAPYP